MIHKLILIKLFDLVFICVLLLNCGGSSNDSIDTSLPPDPILEDVFYISQTIDGEEVQREVLLHFPENFDQSQSYPIVIAFHGNGGQNNSWFNQLSQFVDIGEFIGVYPQGYLNSWNLGAEASTADEVYFFNQIMDKLETYSFFDASKVYGIGVSNGSALINKLAIETLYFSAIAALASQLIVGITPSGSTAPVAVYQMCGMADNIIPYDGGMSVVGHHFLSASNSALSWVNAFNCATEPIVEMLGEDEILIYTDCESGKEIRFHSVNNAGHNLNQPNTPNFYGPVWEFLKRF